MQNLDSEVAFASKYISQVAKLVEEKFEEHLPPLDRKSTRLNSSHVRISYAVFCLKKKKRLSERCVSRDNSVSFGVVSCRRHVASPDPSVGGLKHCFPLYSVVFLNAPVRLVHFWRL